MECSKQDKGDNSIVLRWLHLHKDEHSRSRRCIGIVLMASAGLLLSSGNCLFQFVQVLLKQNQLRFSVFQMLFLRMLIGVVFCIPIMVCFRVHPYGDKKKNMFLLLLMGVAEVGAILCFYLALEKMPVGDATAIKFTVPIFTAFLGFIVLKQECTFVDALFGATSFFGVVMVAKPDWFEKNTNSFTAATNQTSVMLSVDDFKEKIVFNTMEYFKGAIFATGCSLLLSTYFLMNTLVGRSQSVILAVFYPSLVGMLTSPLMMFISKEKVLIHEISSTKWGILVTISVVYFFGMLFMAEAFQMDNIGPVVLIRYCDVVYAFVLQYFLIKTCPTLATLGGALIILLSTFLRTVIRLFGMPCKRKEVNERIVDGVREKEPLIKESD